MDDDLSIGILRLSKAVQQLQEEDTVENRELVCMETRAVFAIFEDESHWQGKEDHRVKQQLVEMFAQAECLMANCKDLLYQAVSKRLDQLRIRDFSQLERISALTK